MASSWSCFGKRCHFGGCKFDCVIQQAYLQETIPQNKATNCRRHFGSLFFSVQVNNIQNGALHANVNALNSDRYGHFVRQMMCGYLTYTWLLLSRYTLIIVNRPGTPKFNFNNTAKNMDFLFRLFSYWSSPINPQPAMISPPPSTNGRPPSR